jgi:hypothetical protein
MKITSMGVEVGILKPDGTVESVRDQRLFAVVKEAKDKGITVPIVEKYGDDGEMLKSITVKQGDKGFVKALWYYLWESGYEVEGTKTVGAEVDIEKAKIAPAVKKAMDAVRGKLPFGAKQHEPELLKLIKESYAKRLAAYMKSLTPGTTPEQAKADLDTMIDDWVKTILKEVDKVCWNVAKTGLVAGAKDAGQALDNRFAHKLAAEWISKKPHNVLQAVDDLGEEQKERIGKVIKDVLGGTAPWDINDVRQKIAEQGQIANFRAETIARTEIPKLANMGRILAWEQDPEKDDYDFWYIATHDDRTKAVSLELERNGPYTFAEIKKLVAEPISPTTGESDIFRNRCSVTRTRKGMRILPGQMD